MLQLAEDWEQMKQNGKVFEPSKKLPTNRRERLLEMLKTELIFQPHFRKGLRFIQEEAEAERLKNMKPKSSFEQVVIIM